ENDIVFEMEEENEEYTRKFLLNNGSVKAMSYDVPVMEADSDGKKVPIQNILFLDEENGLYHNNRDTMFVSFSEGTCEVTVREDETMVRWKPDNNKEIKPVLGKINNDFLATSSVSQTITYQNVFEDTDIEYVIQGNEVKESVIVKQPVMNTFTFLYQTEGLKIQQTDERELQVFDTKGNEIYRINVPYMIDSKGVLSDCLYFRTEKKDSGYRISVIADETWLLSPERSFPVIIDPTITSTQRATNSNNTSVNSAHPDSSAMYQYGAVYVGRESGSYEKLRGVFTVTLPTLTESDRVTEASIFLTQLNYYGSGSMTVKVHPITKNLSLSTLTWNKLKGNYESIVADAQVVNNSTKMKKVYFDITGLVQNWYLNGNNYGLVLTSDNENGDYKYSTFFTSRYPGLTVSQYPTSQVTYRNYDGLVEKLTYQNMGNDSMGTVHVGEYNGNMIYEYTDLSMDGNFLPVTIKHYFSHSKRNVSSEYGSGFYLNYSLHIMETENPALSTVYPYSMTDEDGTVMYFKSKQGENGEVLTNIYHEEDDSSFELKVTETGYELQYDDCICKFDSQGRIIHQTNIPYNKESTIEYDSNGFIAKITDGAGRDILFHYENGLLAYIEDPAARRTRYQYDINNRLIKIIKQDGSEIQLTYDAKNRMTNIRNVDASGLQITYNTYTPYRVREVKEYGKMGENGQFMLFTYRDGETEVSDNLSNYVVSVFDDWGQTISKRDNLGNGIYGSVINTAEGITRTQSGLQSTVRNYVLSHDMEFTSS
ncbi:MAG: RHS repeat protein, partial [Erysipelotrichaceae bacterium]|nr:RHS repeat protein [Erysipelotrichaceae bacterium]